MCQRVPKAERLAGGVSSGGDSRIIVPCIRRQLETYRCLYSPTLLRCDDILCNGAAGGVGCRQSIGRRTYIPYILHHHRCDAISGIPAPSYDGGTYTVVQVCIFMINQDLVPIASVRPLRDSCRTDVPSGKKFRTCCRRVQEQVVGHRRQGRTLPDVQPAVSEQAGGRVELLRRNDLVAERRPYRRLSPAEF